MQTSASCDEIAACGVSETGSVRAENQDAVLVCDPERDPAANLGYLFALADGMGGYTCGDLASGLALKALNQTFYTKNLPRPAPVLRQGVVDANLSIYQEALRVGMRMGTTLTAVSLVGDRLHVAHVGDSRAYLVRQGKAQCLTNDHTLVGDLVRMKVLTPAQVRTHTQRSVLNRCLGLDLFVQPEMSQAEVRAGDVIILCSDGVWAVVQDEEFASLAVKTSGPHALSQDLIELALDRQSDDNVSVVAVKVRQPLPRSVNPRAQRHGGLGRFFDSWKLRHSTQTR
jgi:PPM family protein phosphatase